eukprot:COSAG06_NODE_1418_length_9522_cov_19.681312_5_plen_57_part_00
MCAPPLGRWNRGGHHLKRRNAANDHRHHCSLFDGALVQVGTLKVVCVMRILAGLIS